MMIVKQMNNSSIISEICSNGSIYSEQSSPVFKEIELKPCPFCGKKVVLRYIDCQDNFHSDGYEIRCTDCNIAFFESCRLWFMFLSPKEREKGMKNIIKRWNRRSG